MFHDAKTFHSYNGMKGNRSQVPPAEFEDHDQELQETIDVTEDFDQVIPPRLGDPPTTADVEAAARAEEAVIAAKRPQLDDDDTEPDSDAAPAGSGLRGVGEPMSVGAFERARPLCDGCGLCSIGRWPPWRRPEASSPRVQAWREIGIQAVRAWAFSADLTVDQLFDRLARGDIAGEPWPDDFISRITARTLELFDGDVPHDARPRPADRAQQVHVRLLQSLLRESGDPDSAGMEHYARGVRLGINTKMPRYLPRRGSGASQTSTTPTVFTGRTPRGSGGEIIGP